MPPLQLPSLTPRQFLLLNLLFSGPQTGEDLRRTLSALGLRTEPSTFSREMQRLQNQAWIESAIRIEYRDHATLRRRIYTVTGNGVLEWMKTRKFYENLAPPSPDLIPVHAAADSSAAYDRETSNRLFRKEFKKTLAALVKSKARSLAPGDSPGAE